MPDEPKIQPDPWRSGPGLHARNLGAHICQRIQARGIYLQPDIRAEVMLVCHEHLDALQKHIDSLVHLHVERSMVDLPKRIVIKSGEPHA